MALTGALQKILGFELDTDQDYDPDPHQSNRFFTLPFQNAVKIQAQLVQ